MTIYRDGQVIELTKEELETAYSVQRRKYFAEEVCYQLQEFYNINPNRGDVNWGQIADDVMDAIAEDDTYWECEHDAFRRVIERYLKENQIKEDDA